MYRMQNLIPQLPPNWERKWDPNNGKFFYINHVSKTTQWDIPTMPQPMPQPIPQQNVWGYNQQPAYRVPGQNTRPTTPVVKPQTNQTSFIEADQAKVDMIMKEYTNLDRDVVETLMQNNNNKFYEVKRILKDMGYRPRPPTPPPVEVDPNVVQGLVDKFENVNKGVVEALLRVMQNNADSCEEKLIERGYKKKVKPNQAHVTVLLGEFKNLTRDVAEEVLIKKSNNLNATRSTLVDLSYVKVESQASKDQKVRKVQRKYPDLDVDLIKMALDICDYDTDKVDVIITDAVGEAKEKAKETVRNEDRAAAQKAKKVTQTTPAKKSTPKKKTPAKSTTFKPHVSKTTEPFVMMPKATTSSTATRPTQSFEQPKRKREISQPPTYTKKTFVPVHTSVAKGPNSSNVVGPNRDLLITTFIEVSGHNKAMAKGPQPGIRTGPTNNNLLAKTNGMASGPAGLARGSAHLNQGRQC